MEEQEWPNTFWCDNGRVMTVPIMAETLRRALNISRSLSSPTTTHGAHAQHRGPPGGERTYFIANEEGLRAKRCKKEAEYRPADEH